MLEVPELCRLRIPVLLALLASPLWPQQMAAPIPSPGFEADDGWEVVTTGGAVGGGAVDASRACGGARSMKLTKAGPVGYVILRTRQPVKLQPQVQYTCRFRFHSEDATLANLLLLRVTTGKDQVLGYNAIDASAGWMSQSLLINSPPGKWEKRVGHYRADAPCEVFVNVALYGNPCTVWVDDFEFLPDDYKLTPARSEFRNACTPEQLPDILQRRADTGARVAVQNGRSTLLLDGRPTPPVLYKGEPYHIESDLLRFGERGISLATVSVRLGSIRGQQGVWLGKDRFDFSVAEANLRKALLRNPQAHIVLDLLFYPYAKWGEENPTECWTDNSGRRGYGTWGNLEGFSDDLSKLPPNQREYWWYPSYYSDKWRDDASAAAAALIEHLRATPYGKAVVGYFISGGHDGQFQVFGSFDYCPASRLRFEQWLRRKYGALEDLRRVWGEATPGAFEAVTAPPPPERGQGMESGPPYLSPGPALDYRDFALSEAWSLRDRFSEAVKAAAGKPVFTVAYGNPPLYDFSPLLGLKSLDAGGAMSYYPYRIPGYALGFKPPSGFPSHDKLFFQEMDTRSWAGSVHNDEVYEMWIGAGLTPAEWQAVNRKLAGVSLANQTGFWYYDMNHFFDAPEIMAEIGRTYREAERLRSRKAIAFRPEVCVVQAPDQTKFLSSEFSSLAGSHFYQLMALEQSGVPYDLHYLSDVLARPDLQEYKVYVFYQTRYLTDRERQGIGRKLARGGKTLIFMHDDGYLSEHGKSAEAQSQLVGLQVRTEEVYARATQVVAPDSPLMRDVQPFLGLNEMLMQIMVQQGQSSFTARAQPFWVTDPAAIVLAKNAEDGRTAAALKKLDGWTSVYLAAPNSLTGDLLNSLARQAGAYVCGPAGQSIAMNGDFLSLHGLRSGEYLLNLPPGVRRVTDVETGGALPITKGKCTLQVQAQKTYWLEFE